MRLERIGIVALLLVALAAPGRTEESPAAEKEPAPDTKRFYLYFESGQAFLLDKSFAGTTRLEAPSGFNVVLGGGFGYNFTDNWGFELQMDGTEPDVRSPTLGKIREFSNITVIPAVRYRWQLVEGVFVPWTTAGFGWSYNDLNDTGNLDVKVSLDEPQTYVGTVAVGFDWFISDDVALTFSAREWIHHDQATSVRVLGPGNRVVSEETGAVNLSSLALLGGIRLFPGQAERPGQRRRLLLADHGPYDTDDVRVYAYALGGHTFILDGEFASGVKVKAPGDFNATLGGGLGVNLSRHWGFEVQMQNTDPEIDVGALGKIAELSNFSILPAVRFRYPFLGGRLVPFALAGVGYALNHVNDVRTSVDVFVGPGYESVRAPELEVQESSVAGLVGVGVEYFLNHHLSIGASVPMYIYPDLDTEVIDRTGRQPTEHGSLNLTGVALLFQIKAYWP